MPEGRITHVQEKSMSIFVNCFFPLKFDSIPFPSAQSKKSFQFDIPSLSSESLNDLGILYPLLYGKNKYLALANNSLFMTKKVAYVGGGGGYVPFDLKKRGQIPNKS